MVEDTAGVRDVEGGARSAHAHIGQVAARTELSLRTIRHYDEVGLVTPSARSRGGFRLYTQADIARLMLIRRMKPLGFTLEQMRELLAATDRLDEPARLAPSERARLTAVVSQFADTTRQRCDDLRRELDRAHDFAAGLDRYLPTAADRSSPVEPGAEDRGQNRPGIPTATRVGVEADAGTSTASGRAL